MSQAEVTKLPDYDETFTGSSTSHDGNEIKCRNAKIMVEKASTATFAGLDCEGTATLTCVSAEDGTFAFPSTLVINKLKCRDAVIHVAQSSTIDIKNIDCSGEITISVASSSTLRFRAGSINSIKGEVTGSSTGVCRAKIKLDQVHTSGSSTWDAS